MIISFFILCAFFCSALKVESKNFADINIYGDTRGFATVTPNLSLDLPYKFSYYGFANLDFFDRGDNYRFYSEHDLYFQIANSPFYLAQQYVTQSGDNNDQLRYGPRVIISKLPKLKKFFETLNLHYEISIFPLQFDHSDGFDMAFEHFYYMKILPKLFKDRLYLSGFVDHNLEYGENAANNSTAVTENQLGLRLINNLYLVAELRYNGYFPRERVGMGLGLQYLHSF